LWIAGSSAYNSKVLLWFQPANGMIQPKPAAWGAIQTKKPLRSANFFLGAF
jgi:hypothetical protein